MQDEDEDDSIDPKGKVHRCTIPSDRYLSPDQHSYLPLSSYQCGVLYLKVMGFKKADKCPLRIEEAGKKLKTQRGLYYCPPSTVGTCSFHCCLDIQEHPIKIQNTGSTGGRHDEIMEYSMLWYPALTVQNLLPISLEAELYAPLNESHRIHYHDLSAAEGECIPVYDFDLSRTLKLKGSINGFDSHVPLDLKPNRKTGGSVSVGDRRTKFVSTKSGFMQGDHFLHLKYLELNVRETFVGKSGARKVTIFSPFWILNKTKKDILITDRKSSLRPHITMRARRDDEEWTPVLFPTNRSTAFFAVGSNYWSKAINLNSVGLKDAVYVLASVDGEIEEETEPVIPHGVTNPRDNNMFKSFTQMLSSPISFTGELPPLLGSSTLNLSDDEELAMSNPKGPRKMRMDFSVSIHLGPGEFDLVKVLKISPRYVLYNNSNQTLQIGQKGTRYAIRLTSKEQQDYYWSDSEASQQICVRPVAGTWRYSGGFRVDEVNDFGLRIRSSRRGSYMLLRVDVSLKGDSMVCAFSNDENAPPYRIENRHDRKRRFFTEMEFRCAAVDIKFMQKGSDRLKWDTLMPRSRTDYAWDYPLSSHKLKVVISGDEMNSTEENVKEYSLDNIKVGNAFLSFQNVVSGLSARSVKTTPCGSSGTWIET